MNEQKPFKLASRKTGGKLGGVLAGIANHNGFDVGTLRLVYVIGVIVAIFAYGVGFVGIPLYLLAWLFGWLIYGYDD